MTCDETSSSNGGEEVKFAVNTSAEFVGATRTPVSLTPKKSGTAAFLAVADTIPSASDAANLLAYREIDFSGTSAKIIQFALRISATQDATSGEVSDGTGACPVSASLVILILSHKVMKSPNDAGGSLLYPE